MDILDKLLFNLNTIASVPRGKRLNTAKEFIMIEDDGPLQGLWRWKRADSRGRTVHVVCNEVRTLITIADHMLENIAAGPRPIESSEGRHIDNLKRIRGALVFAGVGISNICHTYDSDTNVSGHLQPVIIEMQACASRIATALSALSIPLD